MESRRLKISLTVFFLALFLFSKLAGLHVMSHNDDEDHTTHCLICEHAIAQNLTPALHFDLEDYALEIEELILQKEIVKPYSFAFSQETPLGQLFSRPPPSIL